MLRLPFAGTRFGCQRFDAHDSHEATNTIPSHGLFRSCQVVGKGAAPHPGMLQVKRVYTAHQFQIAGPQT